MFTEIILFIIVFVIAYYYWNPEPDNLPPGPIRFPIIGSGIPMKEAKCRKLSKKYGKLYMEKMGNCYFLVVCEYNLIKDLLSKFENRPVLEIQQELGGGTTRGVVFTNGGHWRGNRRFILHHLRDCGMGKSYLEQTIRMEAEELVKQCKLQCGKDANFPPIVVAVLNIVWQMIAGKRYEMDDPFFVAIERLRKNLNDSVGYVILLDFIPILKKVIPEKLLNYFFNKDNIYGYVDKVNSFVQPLIDEHKENLDPDYPKDLIDLYLLETENPQYLHPESISFTDLNGILNDLFSAGSDTVSNTTKWAILYLAKYSSVQDKLHDEIDNVVPRDQLPGYEHRAQLPYLEAFIHEVLRKSSLANFGLFRVVHEDCNIDGYFIPKNTVIAPANFLVHHDPTYWKDPDVFEPERFMCDGKFQPPKEGFLPFGLGKRQCLGEGLARSELYIFISALVQNFKFSPAEGKDVDFGLDLDGLGLRFPKEQLIRYDLRE